jgi:hypothetical protein
VEESKTDWRIKVIESFHLVLMILGFLLFVLGITGGIRYKDLQLPIDTFARQATAVVVGLLILISGIAVGLLGVLKRPTPTITPEDFGITIHSPKRGDVVTTVDVHGTLKKKIPNGYTLRVIRVYPDNKIYPLHEAILDRDGSTWEVPSCDIGGNPGDDRALAACLCGPGAEALFAYLADAVQVHNAVLNALPAGSPARRPLPPIAQKIPDLVECFRVPLKRAPRSP